MTITNPLHKNVEDALSWAPNVDASRIGVATIDGVVTLTGHVPSYANRMAAERAAKNIYGVKAVTNDLEIDLPGNRTHTDPEIAEAAGHALEWAVTVPEDEIKVSVRNGWVTLEGRLDWQYQRQAAWSAVHDLVGVKGVSNSISVKPLEKPYQVKEKIEAALRRDARVEAKKIKIETDGHTVVLRGDVDSWSDLEDVSDAAWSAPGVWTVDNFLVVAS